MCTCPVFDAQHCADIRYGMIEDQDMCGCACHIDLRREADDDDALASGTHCVTATGDVRPKGRTGMSDPNLIGWSFPIQLEDGTWIHPTKRDQ